jgi:hypothetical protein
MTIRDYFVTMLYFDSYHTENVPEDTCVKTYLPPIPVDMTGMFDATMTWTIMHEADICTCMHGKPHMPSRSFVISISR